MSNARMTNNERDLLKRTFEKQMSGTFSHSIVNQYVAILALKTELASLDRNSLLIGGMPFTPDAVAVNRIKTQIDGRLDDMLIGMETHMGLYKPVKTIDMFNSRKIRRLIVTHNEFPDLRPIFTADCRLLFKQEVENETRITGNQPPIIKPLVSRFLNNLDQVCNDLYENALTGRYADNGIERYYALANIGRDLGKKIGLWVDNSQEEIKYPLVYNVNSHRQNVQQGHAARVQQQAANNDVTPGAQRTTFN